MVTARLPYAGMVAVNCASAVARPAAFFQSGKGTDRAVPFVQLRLGAGAHENMHVIVAEAGHQRAPATIDCLRAGRGGDIAALNRDNPALADEHAHAARQRQGPAVEDIHICEKRRGRLFLVEALTRGDSDAPRVGYTVTKKVGIAVVRNPIRRRLKEAVRTHAADDMATGNDYVIVGREDVLGTPFGLLKAELSRRLRGSR